MNQVLKKNIAGLLTNLSIAIVVFSFVLAPAWANAQENYDLAIIPQLASEIPDIALSNGAASYVVPIEIPPGRNGLKPDVKLVYNSQSKNSHLGVGWSLSIPYIQRSAKFGLDYAADDYVVNGGQELVERSDWGTGFFGAKIENDFTKYEKTTNGWIATDRAGTKYYYGSTLASRQYSGSDVFKWLLDKVEDTNGNYISYTYSNQGVNNPAISLIRYANHASLGNGKHEVSFEYEGNDRPDITTRYDTKFKVVNDRRLTNIKTKYDGSVIRDYKLSYNAPELSSDSHPGAGHALSSLSKIEIKDASGTILPPPTTFAYMGDTGSAYETSPAISWNGNIGPAAWDVVQVNFSDVNVDGHKDIVFIVPYYTDCLVSPYASMPALSRVDFIVYKPNGSGAYTHMNTTTYSPQPYCASNFAIQERQFFILDFDGDTVPDIAMLYTEDAASPQSAAKFKTWKGNGNGGFVAENEVTFSLSGSANAYDIFISGEINGDGKTDLIKINSTTTGTLPNAAASTVTATPYQSNGDGTFAIGNAQTINTYSHQSPVLYPLPPTRFSGMDINGDGLTDLTYFVETDASPSVDPRMKIRLASGLGTFTDETDGPRFPIDDIEALIAGDLNGDGLPDIVTIDVTGELVCNYYNVSKNALVKNYVSLGDGNFADPISQTISNMSTSCQKVVGGYQSIDLDIDGVSDFVVFSRYGGTIYVDAWLRDEDPSDLLTSVKKLINSDGLSVDFQYAPYSNPFDSDLDLPFILQTVTEMTVDPGGSGVSAVTEYQYVGGGYDSDLREFKGFENVTKTRSDGANDLKIEERTFLRGEYTRNKPSNEKIKSGGGSVLSETDYDWDEIAISGTDSKFVRLNYKETKLDNNSAYATIETYGYFTSSEDYKAGNVKTVTVTGGGAAETVTSEFDYADKGNWTWRKSSETITGSSTGLARSAEYVYESGTGNLLTHKAEFTSGQFASTVYTYDAYGNKVTVTDPEGNQTSYQYETTKTHVSKVIYPTTINNVAHEVEFLNYRYDCAKPGKTIDENNKETTYAYDNFCRPTQVSFPDGGLTTYTYDDNVFPREVKTSVKENASSNIETYEWFDGLSRSIQTRGNGYDNGSVTNIFTNKEYDALGRASLEKGPYYSGDTNYPWISYQYDALGRVTTATSPNCSNTGCPDIVTAYSYLGFDTTITDPDGNQKAQKRDRLGRIVEVVEKTSGGDYSTLYVYNAAGDLKTVTDHEGNAIVYQYDLLGRKTSMDDPDLGDWDYEYDLNGNLTKETNPVGDETDYDYDKLNRMTSKTADGETTNYVYDTYSGTEVNAIGRMVRSVGGGTEVLYPEYDEMGRVEVEQYLNYDFPDDGSSHGGIMAYAYDLSGKPARIDWDADYYVTYDYHDGTGLLSQIDGTGGGDSGYVFASITDYEPSGKIRSVSLANGTSTLYDYDEYSTRLLDFATTNASSTLAGKAYWYSEAGDITKIIESEPAKTVTYLYGYDDLHRLTSETSGGEYSTLDYAYSSIGNIESVTVGGTNTTLYDYNASVRPRAVTQAVGSLSGDVDYIHRTISYNQDNMPTHIKEWENSQFKNTYFNYYPDGSRAGKRVVAGATDYSVLYLSKYHEARLGTNPSDTMYIFGGNLRLAKITDGVKTFFHKDHLGSSVVITDENGNEISGQRSVYKPFGADRETPGITESAYKFTDQELDSETGLYNYDARLYDPVIGRFITADSIIPDLYNPQSLNRYSYTLNNPLIYVDPSGHVYYVFGKASDLSSPMLRATKTIDSVMSSINSNYKESYVVSTIGQGKHNPGSKHYSGNAVDIRIWEDPNKSPADFIDKNESGWMTKTAADNLVKQLKKELGDDFTVLNERTKPEGQKKWGGPHIHVQYNGSAKKDNADVSANNSVVTQNPGTSTGFWGNVASNISGFFSSLFSGEGSQ